MLLSTHNDPIGGQRESPRIVFDESIVEQLVKEAYRPEYGARELRRRIRQVIENPLERQMLDGAVREGSRVVRRFDARQDDTVFELREVPQPELSGQTQQENREPDHGVDDAAPAVKPSRKRASPARKRGTGDGGDRVTG